MPHSAQQQRELRDTVLLQHAAAPVVQQLRDLVFERLESVRSLEMCLSRLARLATSPSP